MTLKFSHREKDATTHGLLHPLLHHASAILFDAGGTLVHPDWLRLAEVVKDETGRNFPVIQMRQAFCEVIRRIDLQLQVSNVRASKLTRRMHWSFLEVFALLGLTGSAAMKVNERLDLEHRRKHLWCKPDNVIRELLFHLRGTGRRLAVISNTEDGRLEESLNVANIASQFEFLIDSHIVGVRKPAAEIFHLALTKLLVRPNEAVYIGDSYGHDIVGAQRAGLHAILLDPLGLYDNIKCPRIVTLDALIDYDRLK